MQQIERYGVIALVFLLVTIVAVSFWGDKKSPGFWSRLTGRGVPKKELGAATAAPATAERALDAALPLSQAPADPARLGAAEAIPIVDPAAASAPTAGASFAQGERPATVALQSGAIAPVAPDPAIAAAATSNTGSPLHTPSFVEPAPVPVAAPGREYVVQKGDSLAQIAQRTLGDARRWPELQAQNAGLDPKRLKVGAKIRLPAGAVVPAPRSAPATKESAKQPAKSSTAKAAPAKGAATYVVRSGDTLRSIAQAKLGDSARWKEIAVLNPSLDPSRLSVGRSIEIPAGTSRPLVADARPVQQAALAGKPQVR